MIKILKNRPEKKLEKRNKNKKWKKNSKISKILLSLNSNKQNKIMDYKISPDIYYKLVKKDNRKMLDQ